MTRTPAKQRPTVATGLILILALFASLFFMGSPSLFQPSPAQAAVAYGAGANPTGDPIGGGSGYSHYYSASDATVVTTASALGAALDSATSGHVVWIPDGTTITISSAYAKTVKSGVVLASNRGQNGAAGGKIKWTYTSGSGMTALLMCQSNCVISGLTLEGPIATSGLSGSNGGSCIGLRGVNGAAGIEVENCEISKFPWAGIYFNNGNLTDSTRHRVHHCYIHNCQRHGYGYGISEEGSCAYLAQCNIFRENRHHIMAQAGTTNPNSYEVCYNEFYEATYASDGNINGKWYYSHQVDCHGGADSAGAYAGNVLKIHHNTFHENPGKPNVCIRGIPKTLCEVSWNWTSKSGSDSGQGPGSSQWTEYVSSSSYQHMTVHDNWYGTTPPSGDSTNGAPATPSTPTGVTTGATSTAYTFQTSATDPDGNQVSFTFTWSDGSTSTTGFVNSGATASATHTWSAAGSYGVTAKATDSEGRTSSSSSPLTVTISGTSPSESNSPPATPLKPSGTTSGATSKSYMYKASTTDPNGDQVKYTFYWSDGTTSTTGLMNPGAAAYVSHKWTQAGTYGVYVRATDSAGADSAWSPRLGVTVSAALSASEFYSGPPATPSTPSGVDVVETYTLYDYSSAAIDPDGDTLEYVFYWGDGTTSSVADVESGTAATAQHAWSELGTYTIIVTAMDPEGDLSDISAGLTVSVVSRSQTDDSTAPEQPAPESPVPNPHETDNSAAEHEDAVTSPDTMPDGSPPANPLDQGAENDNSPMPTEASNTGHAQWLIPAIVIAIGLALLLTAVVMRQTPYRPPRR